MDNPRNALSPGYQLHWYTIKRILGQGGFGITYLAEDTNLNQNVAIKEFLPTEMAVRDQSSAVHPVSGEYGEQFKWGLDRFMSEAQTLAKFKHPNIVRVFTVFPENNTAYMVMEYEHGKGLHELLKNRNTLNEDQLRTIINPILDGLKQVHAAGFIHRDIKPANIYIREDGSPVLLDFGSARQAFGQQTRTLTTMVSPGFAPFEQYVSKSDKQGPWTDIYGLGATMYRAVIGRSPSEAMERSEGLLHAETDTFVTATEIKPEGYSPSLLSAIDHALEFKPENRPQSISSWQSELEGITVPDQAEIETVIATRAESLEKTEILNNKVSTQDNKKPSLFRRLVKYTLIGFVILFVLAILDDENKDNEPQLDEAIVDQPVTDKDAPEQDESDIEQSVTDEIEQPLVDSVSDISSEQEDLDQILHRANKDIRAHRLSKPDGNNAVEKFHHMLELDPGNLDAQEGLFNVTTEYLKLTEQNIQNKKLEKAGEYLALAKEISPDHPDISTIEKILIEDINAMEEARLEEEARLAEVERLAEEAREKKLSKPLISDADKKRISDLQAQIKDNPRDRDTRKKLLSIMKSYEPKVKEAIDAGNFDTAINYLNELLEIAPRSVKLKSILKKVEEKKKQQFQQNTKAGSLFRDAMNSGGEGPEMVIIPAGSFKMGSERHAREFFTGEHPIHKVKIEKSFAMSTKEISISEFATFVNATGYQTEAEWQGGCGYWDKEWKIDPERNWQNPGFQQGNNNPVVCISWNDAIAAARWLSKQTGHNYRLPTEAEWEYAARADKKGETYWGTKSDEKCQYENLMDYDEKSDKTFFQCTDGYTYTAPTGNFNANPFGLYDMLGNVLELTMDCFNENYKGASKDGRAITKGNCSHKMLRGGAWVLPRGESNEKPTLTGRIPWVQNNSGFMIGFRLMREL